MSNLFEDNNENNFSEKEENFTPNLSLDDRKEQLEDKINKEMNSNTSPVSLEKPTHNDSPVYSASHDNASQSIPYTQNTQNSVYTQNTQSTQNSAYTQNTQSTQNSAYTQNTQSTRNTQNTSYVYSGFVPHCCDDSGQKGSSQTMQGGTPYYPNYSNVPNDYNPRNSSYPGSPYSTYDCTGGAPYYGEPPKKPMGKGLKAFYGVIIALCGIFVIGFIVECVNSYNNTGGFDVDAFMEKYGDDYGYNFDFDLDSDKDSDYDFSSTDSDNKSSDGEDKSAESNLKAAPDPSTVINANAGTIVLQDQPEDIDSAEYTARKAYKKVESSVVSVITYYGNVGITEDAEGEGTGIIITSDGYIVTNSHVISDTKDIGVEVVTSDGTSYVAVIVGFDTRTDLAVLKIDGEGLTPAEFVNSDQIEIGQDALAIGNPGGIEYSNSLTKGAVSALDRTVSSNVMVTYIQTDAAINPGNSGGPLLNSAGQVMGINTIKIADTDYEGMGFAIPSNTVAEIVNDLMTQGYVSNRVRIGISGQAVSSYLAMLYDVPSGIMINSFSDDSPFKGTDAKVDDIITAINGEDISSFSELYNELAKYEPGDRVTVTLFRANQTSSGGKSFDVEITLLEDKGETQD